ncbi:MAG: 4Fe-4S dicluster domain-containing protein [Clostridiales bacterium]|nr:4Fe-4S dicluster domain-containing protein [Clostridiales bacterium]
MSNENGAMIINDRMIRKNKALKIIRKNSLKRYGKPSKGAIRNKFGKVVSVEACSNPIPELAKPAEGIRLEKLLEVCKEKKITGMSGSGFPVDIKIEGFIQAEEDTKYIVINGAECEPGLLHDEWLIEHRFDEIVAAAAMLGRILGASCVAIAAKAFPGAQTESTSDVVLSKVPALYPMGEEKILIRQVLGMELNVEDIPVQKGILVINVQTLLQITKALAGQSIDGRYVTLCNLDTGKAVVSYVKYGESIKDKLIQAFGQKTLYKCGFGVMCARDVRDEDTFEPTTCFAAVQSVAAVMDTSNKCKGCGKCTKVCPAGVEVKKVIAKHDKHLTNEIAGFGIEKCIGCGSCSFVCAANKNPHEIVGEYHAKIKG